MMRVTPRRFASPFGMQRAKLEAIHQPLYSCYLFGTGTAPSEALLFKYGVGGQVATNQGTTTIASFLHTNLPAAGFLPMPKVFCVAGIRIVVPELSQALIDPVQDSAIVTTAAQTFAGQDSNLLEDLQRILYGAYVRFFVGTKDYLVAPNWMCPGNVGLQGESSDIMWGGASGANVANTQHIQTFHGAGKYFALNRYPTIIPSQQEFQASINFPQSTRPTLGATRPVYIVFDGILGRETQ